MGQEPDAHDPSRSMWGSGARLARPTVGGTRRDHPKGSGTRGGGVGQGRACWDLERDRSCC